MMSIIQIFSLVLLVIAFAVAIWRHMNVGLTTIPAGFVLVLVAGSSVNDYFAQFPGSLVVLILGVTFLFGHAQRSGAIDRLTELAARATGRRDWVLPWIMFLLAAVLSGIGALPAAALAIVVPIAMRTAQVRGINPMLMGLVTIMGALAGGFSPISVWGQLVTTLATKAERPISSLGLFLIEFVLNLLVAIAAFVIFGGLRLMRRHAGDAPVVAHGGGGTSPQSPDDGGSGTPDVPAGAPGAVAVRRIATSSAQPTTTSRTTAYQVVSLIGIAVFVAAVLIFSVDVGLTAFAVALILQVVFRPDEKEVLRSLPWGVVLVVSGVLLYVGMLEQIGTFDAIADHLGDIGSFALAILALAFVGSLFASFESSSVAVLGLVIPVAIQVTPGVSGTPLLLILCAACWAIVVVSPSPYHLSGGLVLASTPESEQPRMFRRLLLWSLGVAVIVPLIGWLLPALGST